MVYGDAGAETLFESVSSGSVRPCGGGAAGPGAGPIGAGSSLAGADGIGAFDVDGWGAVAGTLYIQ